MRKIIALLSVAPLLLAGCASILPSERAGADISNTGTGRVVRFYSRQAPNLYVDWKYTAGRIDKEKVAEVAPGAQRDGTQIVSNPRAEAWGVGEVLDISVGPKPVGREMQNSDGQLARRSDAPVYIGSSHQPQQVARISAFLADKKNWVTSQ